MICLVLNTAIRNNIIWYEDDLSITLNVFIIAKFNNNLYHFVMIWTVWTVWTTPIMFKCVLDPMLRSELVIYTYYQSIMLQRTLFILLMIAGSGSSYSGTSIKFEIRKDRTLYDQGTTAICESEWLSRINDGWKDTSGAFIIYALRYCRIELV